jgi:hypothetical protein
MPLAAGSGPLVIPEGPVHFEPLPAGPQWEEYRTPRARKLAKQVSLPAISERWTDTVECCAPYNRSQPVSWHEFNGAKFRETRRNVYDKQRRIRRNRALQRLSAFVDPIRRVEIRFERAAKIVSLAKWIHFFEVERARDKKELFERRVLEVNKKFGEIFNRQMIRIEDFAFTGWVEWTRKRKRQRAERALADAADAECGIKEPSRAHRGAVGGLTYMSKPPLDTTASTVATTGATTASPSTSPSASPPGSPAVLRQK